MKLKNLSIFTVATLFMVASCGNNNPAPQEDTATYTLNETALTMDKSTTHQLLVYRDGNLFTGATWSSDNTTVAVVDANGLVASLANDGIAHIVATISATKSLTCTVTVGDGGGEIPGDDHFATLANNVKANHNYTLSVHSYLVGYEDDPDTIYNDTFYMIDNKAFYNTYYSGFRGIIYQKNQGYVDFIMTGDNIINPTTFESTNPNVGLANIYDLVAENLFLGTWVKDNGVPNRYKNNDTNVIAVGCNFTGYVDSSWFVAPSEIIADATAEQIVFTVNFQTYFIDEGDTQTVDGICTITLKNVGTTANEYISAYINNPTKTYSVKTRWDADDAVLFNNYFAQFIPSFPTGLGYAVSMDTKETYNGVDFYLTDYTSGNLTSSYLAVLKNTDGFEAVEGNNKLVRKVEVNEELGKKTTWEIEVGYQAPETEYYGRTIGYFYPQGIFQIKFHCRTTNVSINTLAQLNQYITDIGAAYLIPLLPFGEEVTQVSNFDDRTENMKQLYGDYYLLYTSTTPTIKLHISSYAAAKADMQTYKNLLVERGYTLITSDGTGIMNCTNTTWNDDYQSFVMISDPDIITADNYKGYVTIRFNVYKPEHDYPSPTPSYPTISVENNEHVTGSNITDFNGNAISVYDSSKDDGYFYASFTCESGYVVNGVSVKNDPSATVTYSSESSRWEIKPSNSGLTSIVLVVSTSQNGYMLGISNNIQHGTVRLSSPAAGMIPEAQVDETVVRFVVVAETGYKLQKVYLLEDETYLINKNPMSENAYYFNMPHHDATIMALFVEDGTPIEPEEPKLSSITLSGTYQTIFEQDDTFTHEGLVVTAHYTEGKVDADVTASCSFSTPDMTTAGTKTVVVTYEEDGITKTASYNITVNEKGGGGGGGDYDPTKLNGSYSKVIPMSNPNYYHCYTATFIPSETDEMSGTGSYVRTRFNAEGLTTVASLQFTWVLFSNGDLTITLTNYDFKPGYSSGDQNRYGPTDFAIGWRLYSDSSEYINNRCKFNFDGTVDLFVVTSGTSAAPVWGLVTYTHVE